MEIRIQPFAFFCSLFILVVETTSFVQKAFQQPSESISDGLGAQRRRNRCVLLSFLILLLMFLQCFLGIYLSYGRQYPVHTERINRAMGILGPWIESLQKSLLFYIPTTFIPLISSKKFKIMLIEESFTARFLELYSVVRIVLYPAISSALSGKQALMEYLTEVVSLSETYLLLFIYVMLLMRIKKLGNTLLNTQLITRYRVEAVVARIQPAITGLLLYLVLDSISRVLMIFLMFLPPTGVYLILSDTNLIIRIALFVLMYRQISKILFVPTDDIQECVRGISHIREHAVGTLNILGKEQMSQSKDSRTGVMNDIVPLVSIPDI